MLGALALEDRPWPEAPAEAVAAAMLEGVRELGSRRCPGRRRRGGSRRGWRGCARNGAPDLPDVATRGAAGGARGLAGAVSGGVRAGGAISARLDLLAALAARLDFAGAAAARPAGAGDDLAAPTGTALPVDYAGAVPSVSVRLQEMFGLTRHPTLGPDARAGGGGAAVAGAAAGADDLGPAGLLGELLRRRAPRPARALSAASLAGGPGGGGADAAGEAARA